MNCIPAWRVAAVLLLVAGSTCTAAVPASDDDRKALRTLIEDVIQRDEPAGSVVQPSRSTPERVRRWLTTNRDALASLRRGGLTEQPWGLTAIDKTGGPARVLLYVFDWHASGQLVVYGLTGGVGKAYLLADAGKAALPSMRVGSSMVFSVPKDPPDELATVVVLEIDGKLDTQQVIARPDAGGRILMHARDAVVHGRVLRYEPQPNKDTLGYWTRESDWASWDFEVTGPGKYAVEILQGCGKGNGGSKVDVSVGEQSLSVTVQDTGGFQNFVARDVGQLTFDKPGRYKLAVKPVTKANKAVMDLRSATLRKTQ